jgi:hypothetical protein
VAGDDDRDMGKGEQGLMARGKRRTTRAAPDPAAQEAFYADALTDEERRDIARQLAAPQRSTEEEVAVMRVMIRRVLERIGGEDPVKALPLVRQGVDAICRALRTDRVLTGEAADSLSEAFAVALREIGEELGLPQS